ncbi:metal ABC transporter substrate-binding protein [Cellulomonas dongxiuzhuiae]|uniref:metal ABC transporter substrate-binding protein n=1 Tax=Cellulomonas dongxiuzhuiae TaxID=2819979 RepID=UPI001AAFDFC9|nr:metal ABC transporter substrate-binding protein [Cellulomonas dongxiuzhuiae]MBO3086858.1 zinc ABC transporter substrate-binding protein [Cellulomonas dongxiuzhuiae]
MSRFPRRSRLLAAVLALPVLVTAACSASPGEDGTVQALASFYPLQMVTQEVGGDRVTVSSLTPPGAEPHDVELSPAQVASVGAAQLVVHQSGFQPAVDDAVAQASPEHVVDAAVHADLAGDAEDVDDHGADPHFWLDPTRLAAVADDVATALSEIDPDGADVYRANADALTARLTALDEAYTAGLATCERRVVVTSHEAFGYLADRYDLELVGISGVDPETEPSPARLREVGDVVRDEGVTTIFFETLVSPKVAQTLAADLGVEAAVLDPIEGLSDDTQDYFSIAEANLEALRVALSCS